MKNLITYHLQLMERIDIATAGGSQHILGAPNFETYPNRFRTPQAKHTKTVSTQTVRFHLHGLSLKLGEMQQVPNAHGLKLFEASTFGSGSAKASRLALLTQICAKQWITKPEGLQSSQNVHCPREKKESSNSTTTISFHQCAKILFFQPTKAFKPKNSQLNEPLVPQLLGIRAPFTFAPVSRLALNALNLRWTKTGSQHWKKNPTPNWGELT